MKYIKRFFMVNQLLINFKLTNIISKINIIRYSNNIGRENIKATFTQILLCYSYSQSYYYSLSF